MPDNGSYRAFEKLRRTVPPSGYAVEMLLQYRARQRGDILETVEAAFFGQVLLFEKPPDLR